VADVSGHGSSAASTAASLRRLMRDVINDHDQTRLVGELNRRFTSTVAGTTAYHFATAVALTFNVDTAELLVCNAGHPPPLWFHAEEGRWTALESARDNSNYNLPVGIVEGISYEQFGVKFVPGDLILCYTDSLIEAASADGSAIELAGLLKLVALIDQSRPARFVPELLAAIDKFNPENLLRDDVTCLLMHVTNTVPKFPVLNRVVAPIRALAGSWGIPLPWLPRKPNGE
jgi:serine phosphatase RsbU (regulator of sigma subunit)